MAYGVKNVSQKRELLSHAKCQSAERCQSNALCHFLWQRRNTSVYRISSWHRAWERRPRRAKSLERGSGTWGRRLPLAVESMVHSTPESLSGCNPVVSDRTADGRAPQAEVGTLQENVRREYRRRHWSEGTVCVTSKGYQLHPEHKTPSIFLFGGGSWIHQPWEVDGNFFFASKQKYLLPAYVVSKGKWK